MKREQKLNFFGQFLLLLATLSWGASFFILKDTISEYPTMYVIGFRFFASALILFILFFKKIIKMSKGTFIRGIILGVFMGLAYITQTYGLRSTTPATNAFLTSLYCILCPFAMWLFFKSTPKVHNIVSALLCLVGIALIAFSSGNEGQNSFLGCALTLLCAIFFCLQFVFIDKFQRNKDDSMCLLTVQLATVSVMVLAISFVVEFPQYGFQGMIFKREHLFNVLYLTIACSTLAPLFQMLGQKFTPANQASIILCFESVFGAIFSVLFGKEKLTPTLTLGFIIIFITVLINEVKIDYKKLLFKKKDDDQLKDC